MAKNLFNFVCIPLFFLSCNLDRKQELEKKDTLNIDRTLSKNLHHISSDTIINAIPDSIFFQIHQIVDVTKEYLSLKQQYKNKLQLMIFPDEAYPVYEVSMGHVIFDRFSTSVRLIINLSSKDIKIHDPHRENELVSLDEFRMRWKK